MTSPSEVVSGYLQAFSGHDPDAIAGFVAEGFRNEYQSALGTGCAGRDEYRRRLPHFLDAFTDRAYEITDLVTQELEGETAVVVRYRFSATHCESRRPVDIAGVMWFGVRDHEITRRTDTWDSLSFLRQIGADPTESR